MNSPKPWIFIAAIIVLMVGNYLFGWTGWITSGELSRVLESLVRENLPLACVVYCVVSIVGSVVFALPGVLFALAAGAVFGPWLGTLLCWLSMSVGAWGSFIVGRYFLKDVIGPRLAKHEALNKLLFEGARKSDVYLLAITRLVPVFPFNLQNFAYGITDIGFVPYAVYSALFILPGTAVYTFAAAGVVDPENRLLCLAIAAVLLAGSLAVAYALKKRAGVSS